MKEEGRERKKGRRKKKREGEKKGRRQKKKKEKEKDASLGIEPRTFRKALTVHVELYRCIGLCCTCNNSTDMYHYKSRLS